MFPLIKPEQNVSKTLTKYVNFPWMLIDVSIYLLTKYLEVQHSNPNSFTFILIFNYFLIKKSFMYLCPCQFGDFFPKIYS